MRYGLGGIVAVALCAVLAGSRSFAAIAQWGSEPAEPDLARSGLQRSRAPEDSTFRRVLSSLDAAVLDALIGAFMWMRTTVVDGRRVPEGSTDGVGGRIRVEVGDETHSPILAEFPSVRR